MSRGTSPWVTTTGVGCSWRRRLESRPAGGLVREAGTSWPHAATVLPDVATMWCSWTRSRTPAAGDPCRPVDIAGSCEGSAANGHWLRTQFSLRQDLGGGSYWPGAARKFGRPSSRACAASTRRTCSSPRPPGIWKGRFSKQGSTSATTEAYDGSRRDEHPPHGRRRGHARELAYQSRLVRFLETTRDSHRGCYPASRTGAGDGGPSRPPAATPCGHEGQFEGGEWPAGLPVGRPGEPSDPARQWDRRCWPSCASTGSAATGSCSRWWAAAQTKILP